MPPDLPPASQAYWKRLSAQLERAGLIADVDGLQLAYLCQLCYLAQESFDEIRQVGTTVQQTNKGGHTNTVVNPSVRVYLSALDKIMRLSRQFGMTPAARLGFNFEGEGDEESEEDDILGFKIN